MESLITTQTKLTLCLSQEERNTLHFAYQILDEIDDFLDSHIVDYSNINKTIIYSNDDDQIEIGYRDFILAKDVIATLKGIQTIYSVK